MSRASRQGLIGGVIPNGSGGAAAARYAYERMVAEALLAITVMDKRIKNGDGESAQKNSEENVGKERGQAQLPDCK